MLNRLDKSGKFWMTFNKIKCYAMSTVHCDAKSQIIQAKIQSESHYSETHYWEHPILIVKKTGLTYYIQSVLEAEDTQFGNLCFIICSKVWGKRDKCSCTFPTLPNLSKMMTANVWYSQLYTHRINKCSFE